MMFHVLDHGFVRLDGALADDLSVVNSARVSFGVSKTQMSDADVGLIGFLMRERHGTPFEHNSFRFHVRCPIFVAREWFRHRIGSFNELSGRYSEIPQVAYIPEVMDVRTQVGKPGAYSFEQMPERDATDAVGKISSAYEAAFAVYSQLLASGVSKEMARMVLPAGTYTEFYWTLNARSLMNFLSLRTDQAAQWEIRQYAVAVERVFAASMPVTHNAWLQFGRKAP